MAVYSKKSEDPTEVALDAIQQALNIRDADVQPATEGGAAAITDSIAASAGTRSVVNVAFRWRLYHRGDSKASSGSAGSRSEYDGRIEH
jgi:hypothetical protein